MASLARDSRDCSNILPVCVEAMSGPRSRRKHALKNTEDMAEAA